MAHVKYKRDKGFLIVLFVVALIIAAFVTTIFLTWEAPVPTRRIEKILPDVALTGVPVTADASGLTEPSPTYVGPVPVPTQQVAIPEPEPERSPISPVRNTESVSTTFNTGPIIIDNRVSQ